MIKGYKITKSKNEQGDQNDTKQSGYRENIKIKIID